MTKTRNVWICSTNIYILIINDRIYYKYRGKFRNNLGVGVGTIVDILKKGEPTPEYKVLKYFNIDYRDRQLKHFLRSIGVDRLVILKGNKKYVILPLSEEDSRFDINIEKISINDLIFKNIDENKYKKNYFFDLKFETEIFLPSHDMNFILNNLEIVSIENCPYYVFYINNFKLAYTLNGNFHVDVVIIGNEDKEIIQCDKLNYKENFENFRLLSINKNDTKVIEFLDKYFLIQELKK